MGREGRHKMRRKVAKMIAAALTQVGRERTRLQWDHSAACYGATHTSFHSLPAVSLLHYCTAVTGYHHTGRCGKCCVTVPPAAFSQESGATDSWHSLYWKHWADCSNRTRPPDLRGAMQPLTCFSFFENTTKCTDALNQHITRLHTVLPFLDLTRTNVLVINKTINFIFSSSIKKRKKIMLHLILFASYEMLWGKSLPFSSPVLTCFICHAVVVCDQYYQYSIQNTFINPRREIHSCCSRHIWRMYNQVSLICCFFFPACFTAHWK